MCMSPMGRGRRDVAGLELMLNAIDGEDGAPRDGKTEGTRGFELM